jgi:hypothetical protein
MRTLSLSAVLLLAATLPAAPALGDKPPRWEYAELSYRILPGRPATVDDAGKETPATASRVAVRWVSRAGEIESKSWEEMADKLKATGFKREGTAAFQKIQFLNILGAEGWELMEQQGGSPATFAPDGFGRRDRGDRGPTSFGMSSSTWLFKRRVP